MHFVMRRWTSPWNRDYHKKFSPGMNPGCATGLARSLSKDVLAFVASLNASVSLPRNSFLLLISWRCSAFAVFKNRNHLYPPLEQHRKSACAAPTVWRPCYTALRNTSSITPYRHGPNQSLLTQQAGLAILPSGSSCGVHPPLRLLYEAEEDVR
eukprot:3139065-Pleurochrysis_carterae.AAC.1